jgi:hypothetical protein
VTGFSTAKMLLLTLFCLHLNFWPETTPLLSPTLCTPQDVTPNLKLVLKGNCSEGDNTEYLLNVVNIKEGKSRQFYHTLYTPQFRSSIY